MRAVETVTSGDRLRESPLHNNVFSVIATKLAFFPFIHSYCWCYPSLTLFKNISPLPVSAAQDFMCVLFSPYRETLNQIISFCAPSTVRHIQVLNSHETNEWMSAGKCLLLFLAKVTTFFGDVCLIKIFYNKLSNWQLFLSTNIPIYYILLIY